MNNGKQGMKAGWWKRGLAVSAFAVGAFAMVPGVAAAWSRWTDVDPVIGLSNGDKIAIKVSVPEEFVCDIGDTVHIDLTLPEGLKGKVAKAWDTRTDCGYGIGSETEIATSGNKNASLDVDLDFSGEQNFPIVVTVSDADDGSLIKEIRGNSKNGAQGKFQLG